MYSITEQKPNEINDNYFPIATVIDKNKFSKKTITKNVYYLKSIDYNDYVEKVKNLIKKHEDDPIKAEYLFNCVEQKRAPPSRKDKILCKSLIETIDNFYDKSIIRFSDKNDKSFMKLPNPLTRDSVNIYGMAGSGKSYWCAQYIKILKLFFRDIEIYLITTNEHNDPAYSGLGINRLDVSDRELIEGLEFDEAKFEEAVVIFDDIETHDKGIYTWIRNLRDKLFLKSRKHNTMILNVIHKGLDNFKTNIPNNECNFGVFFPRHGWAEAQKILTTYFDIDQRHMNSISSVKKYSRWICVSKTYPKYIIHEKGIMVLE